MKRKTYNNVLKAGKMIQKKGYDYKESLEMAVKIFDNMEMDKKMGYNIGHTAEMYINDIISKELWLSEYHS